MQRTRTNVQMLNKLAHITTESEINRRGGKTRKYSKMDMKLRIEVGDRVEHDKHEHMRSKKVKYGT